MTTWQPVQLVTNTVLAKPSGLPPGQPAGLWTLVADFVEGPALLKITATAENRWAYAESAAAVCGADGDTDAFLLRSKCLVPTAPVGALIGKIGGSSAGVSDGTTFVAGRVCVVRVPDDGGPLYLTINDEYTGMANNADFITVQVWSSPVEPAAKPAQ
jgi:hypothetical protein